MADELHPVETITSLYLIRHGHTEPVAEGKLYNDPNVELTEKGELQAKNLGKFVKELGCDLLLSSTAKRVVSTAKLIEESMEMKNIPQEDLNEWSVGSWEGRTYLEVKKEDPKDYQAWSEDPITNAPPGGESIEDLYNRVTKRMEEIIAQNEGKKIALVTHAGVVRAYLVKALGMPVRNFWRLNIPVGSVCHVDVSKSFATVHYTSKIPN